ncbi:metallophosphoesterase [Tundrisphaera sp. TA3]|uniref:metallophosphoesterase n=1 Tax=Tundrisphaera sp. TA3 TaxID=3435775 RepID=UPI003EB82A06
MIAGPDGWQLAPEGAAIHPGERVAVIADVHLGYEWARARGGDCLPAHSLRETLAKLATLFDRVPEVDRLVIAGDLVESAKPCLRTAADVRGMVDWLARRGVRPELIQGNHDPRRSPAPASVEVAGWTIAHGHRPIAGERTISGHHHPVLRAQGLTAPCFLVGPTTIVLPAFTPNAAGLPLGSPDMPRSWLSDGLRCVAGLGDAVLDFGPLPALLAGLRQGVAP